MPRSPWLASAGCTNMAGVPVDAKGGGNLASNMPALAHTHHDHPPLEWPTPWKLLVQRCADPFLQAPVLPRPQYQKSPVPAQWRVARTRHLRDCGIGVDHGAFYRAPLLLLVSLHDRTGNYAALPAGRCAGRGGVSLFQASPHAGLSGRGSGHRSQMRWHFRKMPKVCATWASLEWCF
jgi:hypothetical protein